MRMLYLTYHNFPFRLEGPDGDQFFIITDDPELKTIDEYNEIFPHDINIHTEGICVWNALITKELMEEFNYGYIL